MPTCTRCGAYAASAEMRRSPKKTEAGDVRWLCKEGLACAARRRAATKKERMLRRRGYQD